MKNLSNKELNADVLEFSFANFKKAGPKIRTLVVEIMREKDLSLREFAQEAGLKYITFLGYMNEKIVSMNFKNMNILRKYILNHYNT